MSYFESMNATASFVLFTLDEHGIVIDISHPTLTLFGRDREFFVGHHYSLLLGNKDNEDISLHLSRIYKQPHPAHISNVSFRTWHPISEEEKESESHRTLTARNTPGTPGSSANFAFDYNELMKRERVLSMDVNMVPEVYWVNTNTVGGKSIDADGSEGGDVSGSSTSHARASSIAHPRGSSSAKSTRRQLKVHRNTVVGSSGGGDAFGGGKAARKERRSAVYRLRLICGSISVTKQGMASMGEVLTPNGFDASSIASFTGKSSTTNSPFQSPYHSSRTVQQRDSTSAQNGSSEHFRDANGGASSVFGGSGAQEHLERAGVGQQRVRRHSLVKTLQSGQGESADDFLLEGNEVTVMYISLAHMADEATARDLYAKLCSIVLESKGFIHNSGHARYGDEAQTQLLWDWERPFLVCLFGVPLPSADDVKNAIHCAQKIKEYVRLVRSKTVKDHGALLDPGSPLPNTAKSSSDSNAKGSESPSCFPRRRNSTFSIYERAAGESVNNSKGHAGGASDGANLSDKDGGTSDLYRVRNETARPPRMRGSLGADDRPNERLELAIGLTTNLIRQHSASIRRLHLYNVPQNDVRRAAWFAALASKYSIEVLVDLKSMRKISSIENSDETYTCMHIDNVFHSSLPAPADVSLRRSETAENKRLSAAVAAAAETVTTAMTEAQELTGRRLRLLGEAASFISQRSHAVFEVVVARRQGQEGSLSGRGAAKNFQEWNDALSAYRCQKWQEALALFRKLVGKLDDKASRTYVSRLEGFIASETRFESELWDGVWGVTEQDCARIVDVLGEKRADPDMSAEGSSGGGVADGESGAPTKLRDTERRNSVERLMTSGYPSMNKMLEKQASEVFRQEFNRSTSRGSLRDN